VELMMKEVAVYFSHSGIQSILGDHPVRATYHSKDRFVGDNINIKVAMFLKITYARTRLIENAWVYEIGDTRADIHF
jgi:hypothetical protein